MSEMVEPTFSKWRQRIWPFRSFELKKLLPLIFIKFLISVNYQILTNLKYTVVMTAKGSGAEVIPILKGWVVLPCAILITIVYSKLSNVVTKKALFYISLGAFMVVAFAYGFILYPNSEFFSPNQSADFFASKVGTKYAHWVAVYRHWIQAVLFTAAELWASVIILLSFWGFANDISTVNEAKRSYNLYIAAGDVGAWIIGPIIGYITVRCSGFPFTLTVQSLIALFLILGFITMLTFWWMHRYVLTDKRYYNPEVHGGFKKPKEKMKFREGIAQLLKSRYLLGIAIMVIAYGLSVNLIEVSWKATIKELYPKPSDYLAFESKVTTYVGSVAFFVSLFFGGNIMRYFGWHLSAQLTPILVGCTGIIFFLMLLNPGILSQFAPILGVTPLYMLVIFGAIQSITSKVAKYSFFDPSKEMAYIPLDPASKIRGKAAIDVVGSRLGKSGSAWIQVLLLDLVGTGSILSISHLLLPLVVIATASWMYSVRSLSRRFDEKNRERIATTTTA